MQAALWIYNLSAVTLIMFAVSKRISQVNVVYHRGNSDQMALPSVNFLNLLPCSHLCWLSHLSLNLKNKTDFHFPKVRFCYQSIISPSTAQLCVFVTLTLCIVPISDSSPFTSVMMNSPLLPLISPSL